jgi:hypothetical protein
MTENRSAEMLAYALLTLVSVVIILIAVFASRCDGAPVITLRWTSPGTEGGTCEVAGTSPLLDAAFAVIEVSTNFGPYRMVAGGLKPCVAGAADSLRVGVPNGITRWRVAVYDDANNRGPTCATVYAVAMLGRIWSVTPKEGGK